jgi:hypothetical protein
MIKDGAMKYLCLIYEDEALRQRMQKSEVDKLYAEYSSFKDGIQNSGHLVECNPLQPSHTATTVRVRGGKVSTTDGPFAETKEQLGGILILESKELNHAIQLMSKHPGVRAGSFEIRPAEDLSQMIRESGERRRSMSRRTSRQERKHDDALHDYCQGH